MNHLLLEALQALATESPHFERSFELVDQVLLERGEDDLANRLLEEIDVAVDWYVIAQLLGMLQWSTADNGRAIAAAAEQWLRDCDDERKVQIALHLETYPFADESEMVKCLRFVAAKFPVNDAAMCPADPVEARLKR